MPVPATPRRGQPRHATEASQLQGHQAPRSLWESDKSLKRYTKASRAQAELGRLPKNVLELAKTAEPLLLCGKLFESLNHTKELFKAFQSKNS